MKLKSKFLTVGCGLFVIIGLFNLAGWIESLEARDMHRHCIFQHADEVFTDQEAADMDKTCSAKSGYSLKGG